MSTAHTAGPWRQHDMEHDSIVASGDRKAVALVMGRSRSPEEDTANLEFILLACNSHDSLIAENARAHEEYSNINFAYQQLSDTHAAALAASEAALLALKKDIQKIEQLCGMVNDFSRKLGLGRKVRSEDWSDTAAAAITKLEGLS